MGRVELLGDPNVDEVPASAKKLDEMWERLAAVSKAMARIIKAAQGE